ncbi:GAF domain-containing protein [Candidatus Sumerlaeota bacterium]|nr:GAF domain-containing protein [Candidatus Sumerlaeota bacterium]
MPQDSSTHARMLQLLGKISDAVVDDSDIDQVLSGTVHLVQSMLGVSRCSIMMLNEESKTLGMIAAAGIPRRQWPKISVPLGEGYSGKAAADGKPLLVRDTKILKNHEDSRVAKYRSNSFMCVPLKLKSRVIGVINVNDKKDGAPFDKDDLRTIVTLSSFIAMALGNAQMLLQSEMVKRNLRSMSDSIYSGLMTVEPDGRLRFINYYGSQLIGSAPESLHGKMLSEILHPRDADQFLSLLHATVRSRAPQSRRFEFTSPANGRDIPLGVTASIVYRDNGEVNSVVFIIEDRSLHREVKKLREMDEAKNNFIAMISHELRTPLTSIKGAGYMLDTSLSEGLNDAQHSMVRLIMQNTERLIKEVNNLLDATYIENDTMMLIARKHNMDEFLRAILPKFERIAQNKKIQLEYINEAPDLVANIDPDKFSKVVENILDNALKFTKMNGKVWLRVDRDRNDCVISVEDTGSGIPKESQPKIFEKFQQAEHTMTREFGGSGLGLFISKALMDCHGGELELARSDETGTVFRIVLPIAMGPDTTE